MTEGQRFVDYYQVLQVHPNCDPRTLEAAYHRLAKLYHPDHTGSPDTARFSEVAEAYKALRNKNRRTKYDSAYFERFPERAASNTADVDAPQEDGSALDDADDHARILLFLYKKRRDDAQNAGVVGYYLQEILQCSDELFEFHKWYLKEKGFVVLTEQGTLAITIQGIDHVISMSRSSKAEKLLLSQSHRGRGSEE
jgi:curved DNA-binding protein